MILQILSKTPLWVWGLLAALVALGVRQLFARRVSPAQVVILPVAMLALSLSGVFSAFGATGSWLLLWSAAFGLSVFALLRQAPPAGTRYDSAARRFELPGSVQPLLLILALFCLKYVVGVWLALDPAIRDNPFFAVTVVILYGCSSAVFAGRTLRLWRLTGPAATLAPSCRR